jgi:hypothetical protein
LLNHIETDSKKPQPLCRAVQQHFATWSQSRSADARFDPTWRAVIRGRPYGAQHGGGVVHIEEEVS